MSNKVGLMYSSKLRRVLNTYGPATVHGDDDRGWIDIEFPNPAYAFRFTELLIPQYRAEVKLTNGIPANARGVAIQPVTLSIPPAANGCPFLECLCEG